jgi:hypothetical protein
MLKRFGYYAVVLGSLLALVVAGGAGFSWH